MFCADVIGTFYHISIQVFSTVVMQVNIQNIEALMHIIYI